MSFILDALKKAEQKRREGSIPDLQTMHVPEPGHPGKRSLWLVVVTVVLVVNGGLLAWLVFKSPDAGREKAASLSPAPAPISTEKESPKTAVQVSPAATSHNLTSPEAKKTLPPAASSAGNDELVVASAASREAPPKAIPSTKPEAVGNGAPAQSTVKKEKRTDTDRPVAASSATAGSPLPNGHRVYELNELPEEIRQGVPVLTLSLHFYTPRAEARMVRINGRNLREGDAVSGGVRVDEITPEGVIFKLQGLRFEVPGLTVGRKRS
ncbi:MAG: general secretion pathway protein GspB [Desulfuromonadales bacterium]